MKVRVCLAILAVLLVASGAWADVTGWQTFNYPAGYPPTMQVLNWSQIWTINQFDPSLGTLTGVEIEWSADASGWMKARNDADTSGDIEGWQYINNYLKRGATTLVNWYDEEYELWPDVPAGEWTTQYDWTASDAGSTILNSGLAPWIGVGTLDLTASASASWSGNGPGTLTFQTHVEKGDAYQLRYIYDEVEIPEPTTMALGALCLVGMGLWRRRRSK